VCAPVQKSLSTSKIRVSVYLDVLMVACAI
jgi:hypothetical protein